MLTSSATYKLAITRPHQRATIVDVIDATGAVLYADLPIEDGSVTGSLTNRVTRSARVTTADDLQDFVTDLFPDFPTDPLSPTRAILRIQSGIQYADGSVEVFPIFVGRIYGASLDAGNRATLLADDRAADVVDFRFEEPRNADRPTVLNQIQTLISEAVAGATFGPHDVADAPMPQITWDEDRGQAVDDLAEALGGRWYALGDGTFVVRAFPYDDGTVVQTFADGEEGLLSEAALEVSRRGVANSVTVVSERVDGTNPVRVRARNTVPGSPTEYGDLFGRVTQIIKIQTPLTNSEAQRLARAQLNAATALSQQWTLSTVADHTMELGDPIRIQWRGRIAVQVIDSITWPLALGPMSIRTRMFSEPPVTLGF